MSELGRPIADGEVIRRQPAVSLDLLIRRRSLLYVCLLYTSPSPRD